MDENNEKDLTVKAGSESSAGLGARQTAEIERKALLAAVNRVRIMEGGRNESWFIDRFSDEDWGRLVDAILGPYKDA